MALPRLSYEEIDSFVLEQKKLANGKPLSSSELADIIRAQGYAIRTKDVALAMKRLRVADRSPAPPPHHFSSSLRERLNAPLSHTTSPQPLSPQQRALLEQLKSTLFRHVLSLERAGVAREHLVAMLKEVHDQQSELMERERKTPFYRACSPPRT